MIKIENGHIKKLLRLAFEKSGLEEYRLEKDFLLTQILRQLVEEEPTMIFKGGTSLSKGYKDIERFSEDVDLTLLEQYSKEANNNTVSGARRLRFNMLIKKVAKDIGFDIKNEILDENKEKKMYKSKRYEFQLEYKSIYNDEINVIKIDNSNVTTIGEYKEKEIKPLICEILNINTNEKTLSSFKIKLQKRERTITDKFFALCKHYLMGDVRRYARHFYDIYKVYGKFSEKEKRNLKECIKKVAESEYENCLLEQKKGNKIKKYIMNDLLNEVCDSKDYKEDYNTDVQDLLYKTEKGKISYKECSDTIRQMIKEGYFDKVEYNFVALKRMSVYKWNNKEKKAKRYTFQEFINDNIKGNVYKDKEIWDEWKRELEENGEEIENGKYIILQYKNNKYICGIGINEKLATKIMRDSF